MKQEMNFEEMRNQIAILRSKLDKQQIVNDRLLRSAMQTKVNKMNSNETKIIVCGIFCIIVYPVLHFTAGISWPLVIATIAMMLFSMGATLYIHRPLHKADLMSDNLASVASILARFKKQYEQWLHYVCPIILTPWISWFCYDYTSMMGYEGRIRWICVGFFLLCGFIGFIIGYYFHRRTVNLAEEVMRQINE